MYVYSLYNTLDKLLQNNLTRLNEKCSTKKFVTISFAYILCVYSHFIQIVYIYSIQTAIIYWAYVNYATLQ